jgi:hypothetical protein
MEEDSEEDEDCDEMEDEESGLRLESDNTQIDIIYANISRIPSLLVMLLSLIKKTTIQLRGHIKYEACLL